MDVLKQATEKVHAGVTSAHWVEVEVRVTPSSVIIDDHHVSIIVLLLLF